ncbi:DUF6766 family protein [Streptomyces goshikiensis]|uniref:DUF6766 family protein n=1 Tax=Streptomyces goshikiensis TaxID=1942 RepID=UPI00365EEDB1
MPGALRVRHRRREDSCRAVRGPAFEAALEHAGQSIAGHPELNSVLTAQSTETDREQKVGAWATPDSPKSASAPGLRRSLCSRSSVTSAEFWHRTLQNWQSELLAVGPITQGDPLRRCVLLLAHPGRSDRAEW